MLGVSLRVGGKSIRANSCSHLKPTLEGVSFRTGRWEKEGPWAWPAPLHPPQPGAPQEFPINNFRLRLTLHSQLLPPSGSFRLASCRPGRPTPIPSRPPALAPRTVRPLAALTGFAAHLAEVGSAAELKFQHQGAVGDLVHILALWKGREKSR